MKNYTVVLQEYRKPTKKLEWLNHTISIKLSADDFGHAEEQTLNAYDACIVISITCHF